MLAGEAQVYDPRTVDLMFRAMGIAEARCPGGASENIRQIMALIILEEAGRGESDPNKIAEIAAKRASEAANGP